MTPPEQQFGLLIEALKTLAATPDEQRSYLVELGVEGLTDELALELDDAIKPLWHQFEALGVSPLAVSELESLDKALVQMSGSENISLWRPAALDRSEWWAVRRQAAECLRLLNAS